MDSLSALPAQCWSNNIRRCCATAPNTRFSLSLDFAHVRSTVNVYNKTCVILAAEVGRVAEVEFFLKCGTDVNAQDIYGSTAAHYSVNETKSRQTLPLLVEYGADLNIKDRFGHTVWHTADRSSDPGIRAFLEDALAERDNSIVFGRLSVHLRRNASYLSLHVVAKL